MSSLITDKTQVVVCRLGDFWVTSTQAQTICGLMQGDGNDLIEIDDCQIKISTIDGVITAQAYDTLQKRRRGAWQCKWRYWHERGNDCRHGEIARIRGEVGDHGAN